MNDILELRNVSVLYGGMEKTAVTDVSLCIPERSIVAIVGESGSGKSTLIRAILGLLSGKGQVTQGEIFFKGVDLAKLNENEYRKLRGKSISMIFQNAVSALDSRKKIGFQFVETIRASAEISKVQAREHAVNALLEVGLSDPERILKSYPFELSGGMAQRVAIAMAVAVHLELLLADEPTSALDVTMQAQVVKSLMDLRERMGTTIIIVTHNLGVASYMADYLAVMHHGRLVDFGPADQIIMHPRDEYTRSLIDSVPNMEVADFEQNDRAGS